MHWVRFVECIIVFSKLNRIADRLDWVVYCRVWFRILHSCFKCHILVGLYVFFLSTSFQIYLTIASFDVAQSNSLVWNWLFIFVPEALLSDLFGCLLTQSHRKPKSFQSNLPNGSLYLLDSERERIRLCGDWIQFGCQSSIPRLKALMQVLNVHIAFKEHNIFFKR